MNRFIHSEKKVKIKWNNHLSGHKVLPLDKDPVWRAPSSSTRRLFVFLVSPVPDTQHTIGHPHGKHFITRLEENHNKQPFNSSANEKSHL